VDLDLDVDVGADADADADVDVDVDAQGLRPTRAKTRILYDDDTRTRPDLVLDLRRGRGAGSRPTWRGRGGTSPPFSVIPQLGT
jgi:hypothetical protein